MVDEAGPMRYSVGQFWQALGKQPDDELEANEYDQLRACLLAALAPAQLPVLSPAFTYHAVAQWLSDVARAHADPNAEVAFLNRLFRHTTKVKGPMASISKRIVEHRIPDSTALRGCKHRLLSPGGIKPLASAHAVRGADGGTELPGGAAQAKARRARARLPPPLHPSVDERLERIRRDNLAARAAALELKRSVAEGQRLQQARRDRLREENIAARQEKSRALALDLDSDED